MCTTEADSMASLVNSLSQSFKQVPPTAIPAMLDCILASTALSPSSLFLSLLDDFPKFSKDFVKKDEKLDSDCCNYIASLVGALCHILKKLGNSRKSLQLFLWKIFLPLIKDVHAYDRETLNTIIDLFFAVVISTSTWKVLETDLVPFLLMSVGISMGMLESEESDVIKWGMNFRSKDSDDFATYLTMDEDNAKLLSSSFPINLSCNILTMTLEAAIQSLKASSNDLTLVNNCCYVEKFTASLLWDLFNMSQHMLLHSSEHRSCTIAFFLPSIFKALASQGSLEVSIHGQTCILSRNHFLKKIWICCKKLFSLGQLERRDAYGVLSLYLGFFTCTDIGDTIGLGDGELEFDLRNEQEFWGEIKKGLVDEEGLVRKQSLHILKRVQCITEGSQCSSSVSEKKSLDSCSVSQGMTKRELWADKEAKSLGVGKVYKTDSGLDSQHQWEAFLLLYEMLEEYGTHLVEAAWNHQVTLLLQFSSSNFDCVSSTCNGSDQSQIQNSGQVFDWLLILWQRGFCHNNPLVRCMIMQSFLAIEWTKYGSCAKYVSESFVLGPFMEGLNDPVHHKDFGVKGLYSSETIKGAVKFLHQYSSSLQARKRVSFMINLALVARTQSLGRAGLMALAECIASSACAVGRQDDSEAKWSGNTLSDGGNIESSTVDIPCNNETELLDALRFVIESSKQHFNPNYRLQVCEKILKASVLVVYVSDVPVETLLHFISAFPREFTDYNGSLRPRVQKWLSECHSNKRCSGNEYHFWKRLLGFPKQFISPCHFAGTFDDEDLDAWDFEVKRWARVFFLLIEEEELVAYMLMFIKTHAVDISKPDIHMDWIPVKFLILILSLVHEIQTMLEGVSAFGVRYKNKSRMGLLDTLEHLSFLGGSVVCEKFAKTFFSILDELVAFGNLSGSVFWSVVEVQDVILPSSVRGRLGGPSQRRLSASTANVVLQAITSMKCIASVASFCAYFQSEVQLKSAINFLWTFFLKTISSPTSDCETRAELGVATYEALVPALKALVHLLPSQALHLVRDNDKLLLPRAEGTLWLDSLVLSFLESINNLLAAGVLARSRRAVLLKWKWLCLESLLSIMSNALHCELQFVDSSTFFSDVAVRHIFGDLVESLENAGEDSVLSMLRSIRLALSLFASERLGSIDSSYSVDVEMVQRLVHSSWILHVSCNKRRVAPIAALLSSVLHSSVFCREDMHITDHEPGPLKWFVEKLLEEGRKSPRTIRLTALHLTGLWLSHPSTIKYYIKELKLLTLYGSVAFDEDFEAELSDNHDAKTEVASLAQSPDPELTEVFINTELYARVSVAVLFHKLANLVETSGPAKEYQECKAGLESGKLLLLDLLDSAVHDKDLGKELYKKYSGIHRRKIRVWQMICVLSRFVCSDIVEQVTNNLHIALYKNNLPAVRQYLETFAINIYLKFPELVGEQLVPILRDYGMRPQALSSYVFIAANVILHAPRDVQLNHLSELLPPVIPLLTSHHHSLRGFTQLLVHQILCKLVIPLDSRSSQILPLEKRCFEDLKLYLTKNSDCARLRSSMEGYLDAYNPSTSVTPAGIFVNRVEENEFECVPTSLMDEVLSFLNDAREDLRSSMAKDDVTIKNESLKFDENSNQVEKLTSKIELTLQQPKDVPLDFQKKITMSKHSSQDTNSDSLLGNKEIYERFLDLEKEDELLSHILQSRSIEMEKMGKSRQNIILVASLLDRIPNLAGLARTCEVFKASALAIADSKVVLDKQFQLISVTAEKWVPIIEVPIDSVKHFLEKKKREGFSILGLEQTANSIPLDKYMFPKKTVLVLGREKEGIPVELIHILDACIEIPQFGVVRSLNVHVSGAIALWEYTRQQRSK